MKNEITKKNIILSGFLVVMFFTMFGVWYIASIPYYGSIQTSILEIADFLGKLQSLTSDVGTFIMGGSTSSIESKLVIYKLLIYVSFFGCLLSIVWPFIKFMKSSLKDLTITKISFWIPLAFSILNILFVYLLNQDLKKELFDMAGEILSLSWKPYVLAIISAAGAYILHKVPNTKFEKINMPIGVMEKIDISGLKTKTQTTISNSINHLQSGAETIRSGNSKSNGFTYYTSSICGNLPIRIVTVQQRFKERPELKIEILVYKEIKRELSAIKVDFELISAFKESTWVRDVGFIDFSISEVSYCPGFLKKELDKYLSNFIPVDLDEKIARETREIKVYIKQVVINDELLNMEREENFFFSQTQSKCIELREKFGVDAIAFPRLSDEDWSCVCGKTISASENICPICARTASVLRHIKEGENSALSQSTNHPNRNATYFCPYCKTKLTKQEFYCYHCGKGLSW